MNCFVTPFVHLVDPPSINTGRDTRVHITASHGFSPSFAQVFPIFSIAIYWIQQFKSAFHTCAVIKKVRMITGCKMAKTHCIQVTLRVCSSQNYFYQAAQKESLHNSTTSLVIKLACRFWIFLKKFFAQTFWPKYRLTLLSASWSDQWRESWIVPSLCPTTH